MGMKQAVVIYTANIAVGFESVLMIDVVMHTEIGN